MYAKRLLGYITCCLLVGSCSTLHQSSHMHADKTATVSEEETERINQVAHSTHGRMQPGTMRSLLTKEAQLTNMPLVDGNRLTLLIDGPSTLQAMFELIEQAEKEILCEYYILADDQIGQQFAEHLSRATARGVEVKVIYDALGSMHTAERFFQRLREAGIEVEADKSPLVAPHKVNNRNHRKMIVIDNHTAIIGGANVTEAYASSSATSPGRVRGLNSSWRDTNLALKGPAVYYYREIFRQDWHQLTGTTLATASPAPEAGKARVRPVYDDTDDGEHTTNIYQIYVNAIEHAEHNIWLTHAYFSPNQKLLDLLTDAAARGVDVRLVLPGFIDFSLIYHASRANYHRLLEAGVRVFERNDALLHAKTAVIDGVWSTVGSANLDIRSFIHNDEANAVVISESFAEIMEDRFIQDMRKADEIRLEEWRQRSLRNKILEWLAQRLNYFL